MGLDVVELIMAVEEEFGIAIPNERATTLTTLGAIRDHVLRECVARGMASDSDEVWARIKAIVRRDFAIAEPHLVPEASLVADLGLD